MTYFIGCDGGSTKTEWVLCDESGYLLSHRAFGGCNIAYLGIDGFLSFMDESLTTVLSDAGVAPEAVTGAMFGLTTYGEVSGSEEAVPAFLEKKLPKARVTVRNDAVAGWAGSLACEAGIHLVAGTGSIAYGQDESGSEARAGGWSILFADEGSCSWVGRELINRFVRQADGRSPKTALYAELKTRLGFADDILMAGFLEENVRLDSTLLAKLQLTALDLAKAGDVSALEIYENAAKELTDLACAVRRQLRFETNSVRVSYFGGLFAGKDVILAPLAREMRKAGFTLCAPRFSPVVGALGLAAKGALEPEKIALMLSEITQRLAQE